MSKRDDALFGEADDRVESVTDFTRRVKTLLESGMRAGWVRGEISNLSAQASGHVYFTLKDSGAQLRAVLFRGDAMKQTVKLRDGLQVVVFGQVSVYEARGQYQLIVRAVAACDVPVISAVGHEIDFTLCDFAADARAETPSAAAELISSHFVEAVERVNQAGENLRFHLIDAVENARQRLEHAQSRLRLLSPAAHIEQGYLRLDDYANRLAASLKAGVQERRHELAARRADLLRVSPEYRIQSESQKLLSLWKRLQSVSPASVLQRGFVIMRDEDGQPVARRQGVATGRKLQAEFGDGSLPVRVE